MAKIQIQHLTKSYPPLNSDDKDVLVLNKISLTIVEGEFVTFFGPNGCGKTTLLKVLAGVEPYDSGMVSIDSKSPQEAKTGLIFQNYSDSLMPWLSCRDNILFPYSLKKRKHEITEAKERLANLLSELKIELPLKNYPYQISGGQQQLIAILRTLIYRPDVILMDEPFSSLDYRTRSFMQRILLDIWHREKPTIAFISHDIEEAIFLADRLVLLGSLPTTIREVKAIPFERPRNRDLFESDEFFHIKRECLQAIKREIQ
ncbi:MAG: Aliphatic sulfonates import ATP-binding protein SsuB [Syntrophorhabdaceae bacterium]|nr:Aliphatic sulfonates import ATP-binding protein SsuB [Syntrophorhabdaceae bacterium]